MKSGTLERALWALSIVAAVSMIGQLHRLSRSATPGDASIPFSGGVSMYDAAALESAADSVVAADPFQVDATAPAPTIPGGTPEASPASRLELSGLSGGPPWRAIVSGIPGHEAGIVVSAGDTVGGIRVRSVRRDAVIIQTKDSTLTFTLKR
jgi:hypothetical protein